MSGLETFHFMRPLWLFGLIVAFLAWWLIRRTVDTAIKPYAHVAPHLQDALAVNSNVRRGVRPFEVTAVLLACLVVAAAGPAWVKQPSPWYAETAPLVIAIEVSDSMRSNDLQPTRLDRARFKVLDLVSQRTGSRTALIAYAGGAHVVMPPTKDLSVIKPFLESLDPAIMPVPGADASAVLPIAQELLGTQSAIGTVLFVNDGFAASDIQPLTDFAALADAPALAALVVGTDDGGVALLPDGSPVLDNRGVRLDTRIDSDLLDRATREAGLSVVRAEAGSADLEKLLRHIESNLQQADDPDSVWRDDAWWLLWPAGLLSLWGFRRGWTMQW